MSASMPVILLTFLGALVAVLGLFAAGSIEVVVIGLVAIAVAGIIQAFGSRRS